MNSLIVAKIVVDYINIIIVKLYCYQLNPNLFILQANRNGTNFPLYGVCLGLEILAVVSGNMAKDVLDEIEETKDISLPLDFEPNYKSSSLFKRTPKKIIAFLEKNNSTANHHS